VVTGLGFICKSQRVRGWKFGPLGAGACQLVLRERTFEEEYDKAFETKWLTSQVGI
jgi:hypothetical protein